MSLQARYVNLVFHIPTQSSPAIYKLTAGQTGKAYKISRFGYFQ